MYIVSVDTFVGDSGQTHTCRDVSRLREWMREKSKRSEDVGGSGEIGSTHGYVDNDDALLPWGLTENEFQ